MLSAKLNDEEMKILKKVKDTYDRTSDKTKFVWRKLPTWKLRYIFQRTVLLSRTPPDLYNNRQIANEARKVLQTPNF